MWTQNLSTAHRMAHGIKSGTVWINCNGQIDPAVDFGGYKISGYGRKGGQQQIDGFLYQKALFINLG